jgi:hypothetical protein
MKHEEYVLLEGSPEQVFKHLVSVYQACEICSRQAALAIVWARYHCAPNWSIWIPRHFMQIPSVRVKGLYDGRLAVGFDPMRADGVCCYGIHRDFCIAPPPYQNLSLDSFKVVGGLLKFHHETLWLEILWARRELVETIKNLVVLIKSRIFK